MKIRTVIGLTGAAAASFVGMAGLAAGPAGAAAAQTMPADQLTTFLATNYGNFFGGVPVFASPFEYPGEPGLGFPVSPNTKVSGNCLTDPDAAWLFSDTLALDFQSGNAVVYRPTSSPVPFPFLPGGLNAEGTAALVDVTTGEPTGFVGTTHAWLGQGQNAQGEFYAGETVSFTGTSGDSTISFTVNPGEVGKAHSAPGVPSSGWGQQNLSCNIVSLG